MKIKALAKRYGLNEDDLLFGLVSIGWFKNNGEPKSSIIRSEIFDDEGNFSSRKSSFEAFEEKLPEIKSAIKDKKIEELESAIETYSGTFEELNNRLDGYESQIAELNEKIANFSEKPKKEKKHRKVDWSNKARSMIGKKYRGWKITGEKLEVVARKGKVEVRASGMKSKEDFLAMIDDEE